MTELTNHAEDREQRGPHEDHGLDDDRTIDGADLLAEIRARLGFDQPDAAPAVPAAMVEPVSAAMVEAALPWLPEIASRAGSTPVAPRSFATGQWWTPSSSPATDDTVVPTAGGRFQLGVLTVALLLGVVLTVLVLGPGATP